MKIAAEGIELNGGYADVTRDFGLDGFDVETALWVSRRIAITGDYDDAYDTSRFGAFEFTGLLSIEPALDRGTQTELTTHLLE